MVDAFFVPVEIIACPTVRDSDGVALSSRNRRLSPTARARAAAFPRTLRTAPDANSAMDQLRAAGFEVDYVNDVNGERLAAIRLEGVRLIDHIRL
jgi:pantoate--beta-alanine ligase